MDTQTRTSGGDTATLGLRSVLVGSLPAALMTDQAPHRYTVEAVFTRRPEREEVAEILGNETRAWLARAGYARVQVSISDRRLEIGNTNLEELRDGLGSVLADRLAEISAGVRADHDAAAARFRMAAAGEHNREALVAELAGSVTFRTSQSHGDQSDRLPGEIEDRARIDAWADEGGHGR